MHCQCAATPQQHGAMRTVNPHKSRPDAKHCPIIFVGGLDLSQLNPSGETTSTPEPQQAAINLQSALVEGLIECGIEQVTVINLPFLPVHGKRCKAFYSARNACVSDDRIRILSPAFSTRRFWRYPSRCMALIRELCHQLSIAKNPLVLIYSAHLPFLIAAVALKFRYPKARVTVFVADLPCFMGGGSLLSQILLSVDSLLCRYLVRTLDAFIVVTIGIRDTLRLPTERTILVEGIVSGRAQHPKVVTEPCFTNQRVFLYAGTIDTRYGILELLEAFSRCKHKDIRLWICGDGTARESVATAARLDPRVKYFGLLNHRDAVTLQGRATVLVNPRCPGKRFTQYSFPSKTIEYLALGKPVIMHRLPGVPLEYYEYILSPKTTGVRGLCSAISDAAEMPLEELARIGAKAREFILQKKTPRFQVKRIIDLWDAIPG